MSKGCDAIIIGASIIGAAVGYELSKRGRRTLNVDMLPAAGYGSTSNSCAIIRVYYSTLDGCAMAYDGFFYWKGWADYLNAGADETLADFHETGNMVMKTKLNDGLRKQLAHLDALGIPYEHWTAEQVVGRFPGLGISSRLQGCVDLYDVTEDWIPLYDRSCVDGFYMACGTSGNQFKNAPVAGKAMAALIEYCEAGNDHDARPMRYRLEHLDHEIDMATFSRLREVNQDSTFSVLG